MSTHPKKTQVFPDQQLYLHLSICRLLVRQWNFLIQRLSHCVNNHNCQKIKWKLKLNQSCTAHPPIEFLRVIPLAEIIYLGALQKLGHTGSLSSSNPEISLWVGKKNKIENQYSRCRNHLSTISRSQRGKHEIQRIFIHWTLQSMLVLWSNEKFIDLFSSEDKTLFHPHALCSLISLFNFVTGKWWAGYFFFTFSETVLTVIITSWTGKIKTLLTM